MVNWLRNIGIVVVVVLTVLGLKAYTDYREALGEVDAKVQERVRKEVAEYRKFTDQIIVEVVNAKARANQFSDSMAQLESRSDKLKKDQDSFEEELRTMQGRAKKRYEDFDRSLVSLPVPAGAVEASAKKEAEFVARSEAFAKKVGFDEPPLKIIFEVSGEEAVQGSYDDKRESYVVNSAAVGKSADLPEYVAIMGRFMVMHFAQIGNKAEQATFWNDFRIPVVAYIVVANAAGEADFLRNDKQKTLLQFMRKIEERTDKARATKLAVDLLKSYEPTWTHENFSEALKKLNVTKKVVDHKVLEESIAATWKRR